MVTNSRGTTTLIIAKKSTVTISNQKKYEYKTEKQWKLVFTYRFFSTLFITAVACKVSTTEILVSAEAAEGSLHSWSWK